MKKAAAPSPEKHNSVRRVLLTGIFWRILLIEAVLLVGSLAARYFSAGHNLTMLFWYAVRIILLITIIIAFMVVTLRRFLDQKIITPLEIIADANRQFMADDTRGRTLSLSDDTPREIREIAATRLKMLNAILKVSGDRLKLANFIRETFGRYMPGKVVDEILESPRGRQIGGRRETVTVLMSDLRGFTGLSEDRSPEDLVGLLNLYLDRMSEVIHAYDGIVDDFIGDAILAVFGAPEKHDDDPARAVACAIAMQKALHVFSREAIRKDDPPLEMGIGIETGPVIMGNIGSETRMKYSIIGATVNVASRLESQTIGGQIVIGETTRQLVKDSVQTDPPLHIMMKGIRNPLVCYPVTGIGAPYNLTLSSVGGADPARRELPVQCWEIKDKIVVPEPISGRTITLDEHRLTIALSRRLPVLTDVRLRLGGETPHRFGDIYAKVIAVDTRLDGPVHVFRITYINRNDCRLLRRFARETNAGA